jgi:5-methylthioadenosine/S-adenosylhomocysteine deaminase
MTNILIQNGAVLTMDEQNTIHTPGWVWLEHDQIQAVGAGQPPANLAERAGRIIDATYLAVLPGLINGHTHLSQTFMRGLGDDKALLAWLKQVMWPIQAAMTPDDMRLAALLGLVENLRCGVTGVVTSMRPLPPLKRLVCACTWPGVGLTWATGRNRLKPLSPRWSVCGKRGTRAALAA